MNKPHSNSDHIVEALAQAGIDTIFMLSGGGIMHLQNAVKNAGMPYVCNFHEQACIISAEAYSRVKGFGACMVTFGPGALNTVSGIASAWYESVPLIVIAGQVRSDIIADYSKVRQLGPQEANVIDVVRPITKFAYSLRPGDNVPEIMRHAIKLAQSGRPGPVLIEVPLDVQATPCALDMSIKSERVSELWGDEAEDADARSIAADIAKAKRPLFILGSGIRLGKAQKAVRELCTNLQIPVITAHTAKDVFDNFNERYFGIFGTCGNRHANVILQNSDLVVALGVGLTISKTGFNFKNFAPLARKIVVDIDRGQVFDLAVAPDHGVVADVGNLIPKLVRALNSQGAVNHAEWFSLCCEWRSKYAEIDLAPEYDRSVNPYRLMRQLSQISLATDTITTGNGLDSVAYCQSFKVKEGQHTLLNGNWGSMGWDLPLSVGAHFATKGRVLCITGDGSIMLNIQELLNIGARQLPIKVFVLNNQGYGSIKATQDSVFNSNYIGVDSNSGVYNPDFKLIATGFGLGYAQIDNDKDMATALDNILSTDTPELIEVRVDKSTWITPKASSFKDEKGVMHSRDLDDMFPFLERSEITNNRALALKIS